MCRSRAGRLGDGHPDPGGYRFGLYLAIDYLWIIKKKAPPSLVLQSFAASLTPPYGRGVPKKLPLSIGSLYFKKYDAKKVT